MPFVRLRDTVGMRATRGESLEAIENEVIEPSGLPEEHKAALWLYGWASQQSDRVERFRPTAPGKPHRPSRALRPLEPLPDFLV